jgi:hypothetical protein
MVTKGTKTNNTKSAITHLLMAGIFTIGTSSMDTWHDSQVFDLAYFSRSKFCHHRRHISKAHFVSLLLLSWNIITYVSLGQITSWTKFRSDLALGLATRGPKPKPQNVLFFTNGWIISNVYPPPTLDTSNGGIHDILLRLFGFDMRYHIAIWPK